MRQISCLHKTISCQSCINYINCHQAFASSNIKCTQKSSSTYITDGGGKMAAVEVTKKPRLDMKKKMEEKEKNRMMKSVVFDEQYIIRLRSCYLIFVFS